MIMEEKDKKVILTALKSVFDAHPQAWKNCHTLGSVVLDCTEFVSEKSCALRLSKGFTSSCREIEEVLRKEKQPNLLADFRIMVDILDQIRELAITAPRHIDDIILITSEFLLAMEEAEA